MPSPAALAIRDLQKRYGDKEVIGGISFTLNDGECVGILGPNGAGKSTTIQMCLGATLPTAGQVCLLGYDIPKDALTARRKIGVVPQKDYLDPDFSCVENLSIYARYFGLSAAQINLPYLLDFAGLTTRADDRITTLSGGMQRRLTLARALVNNPDFIFLDEPTTGLDPQARHLMWERLRQLQEGNKTLLLTTHFMEEAERLCDRVYIMDNGQIIADGKPTTLIQERIERDVVEIYGDNSRDYLRPMHNLYNRCESFGNLTYCYADDATLLIQELQKNDFRFIHRCANLEDVFLLLTGHDLCE